ncbi:hypothetical protein V2K57_17430, partial [Pseudomonas alliivorans]|nr:hypothetical protein [Pseudomonas alliivorans]
MPKSKKCTSTPNLWTFEIIVMLIDEKTKLAIWHPSTQKSVLDTLQRVKSAVDQNPGYKVAYEFPNQKVEAQAKAFIRSNGFDSVVRLCTKSTVSNTAWHKPVRPLPHNFL